MPSVDVVTGQVTNGPIKNGQQFQWTAANSSGNITVTGEDMPSNGDPWFSPSPTSFTAPSGSATVTAKGVSPPAGWSYTANIETDNTHIQVSS